MERPLSLQEPMDMPNRFFPIKVHYTTTKEYGMTLFNHHWHNHLEFLYFTKGSAMIELNSVPYDVREGDLVVINSNDLHYGVSQCDDLVYYAMILDIKLLHSHSIDAIETKFITPISQNRILFASKITERRRNHQLHILPHRGAEPARAGIRVIDQVVFVSNPDHFAAPIRNE